jgi:hypothetical protein
MPATSDLLYKVLNAIQNITMVGGAAKVTSASYVIAVTPSDATVYDPPLIALRVGTTAGDVSVVSNGATVVIPAMQAGESLAMEVTKVLATGTTATGITGWQGA